MPPPSTVYDATGCTSCKQLGFRGRLAIGEAFFADDPLLRAVADDRSLAEISEMASLCGLRSMALDGLDKAYQGFTTIEEVMVAVNG
jgi:type II secretory ATPase GspE/PulE/Tfp pilus assembly ATPase PilB-like protein